MADRWENTYVKHLDAHHSRIIASWLRAGGSVTDRRNSLFEDWLTSLGIGESERLDIIEKATCGKLELETNAFKFLAKKRAEQAEVPD